MRWHLRPNGVVVTTFAHDVRCMPGGRMGRTGFLRFQRPDGGGALHDEPRAPAVSPPPAAPLLAVGDFAGEWASEHRRLSVTPAGEVTFTQALRPLSDLSCTDAAVERGDGGQSVLAFTVRMPKDAHPGGNRDGAARWHLRPDGACLVTFTTPIDGIGRASPHLMARTGPHLTGRAD